jgi:uncharacterized protein (TIGR00269 family)
LLKQTCRYCSSKAVYTREYEGVPYCSKCFREALEEKVRRTITRNHMLEHNDIIAIGVSGGKDSLTLLRVLAGLETRYPNSKMIAISVDEGIEGYRDEALRIARNACEELGVEQVVVSYQELFGTTMDGLAKLHLPQTPCSYCGVFRRKAINRAASKVGATKIATAHNLDDEVQTVLLNMLHGDPWKAVRSTAVLRDPRCKFLPRIKPLCEIPEKEIVLYAYLNGFDFQSVECPHGGEALRNDIRSFLNQMEQKHAGIKFTLQRTSEKLQELLARTSQVAELNACARCGDPTPHQLCEACIMLDVIAA